MEETIPVVELAATDAAGAASPAAVSPDRPVAATGLPTWCHDALLVNLGWLGTGLASKVADLPFSYVLKDGLHLTEAGLAAFVFWMNFPIYVKPLVGIFSDGVPIFGTRRKHYLLISLLAGGALWMAVGLVPRTYSSLIITFLALNVFLVLTSCVLGGLMVEVGKRDNSTGKLSAERVGITRVVGLVGSPLGGLLVRLPFAISGAIAGALHLALFPLYSGYLKEEPVAPVRKNVLPELSRQCLAMVQSRTLMAAAGLIILVIASPGFGTPLFYYQTNELKFSPVFIGSLGVVGSIFSVLGAILYRLACTQLSLRRLLVLSIVVHVLGTLTFLAYHSHGTALVITAIESMTNALAILPLYDLAARATPKGSEALGYSVMMSVWNLTQGLSNVSGSWLSDHFHLQIPQLVWINAGTTALVLLFVPFLPKALMDRKDGEQN